VSAVTLVTMARAAQVMQVDEAAVHAFRNEGVVVLRGVFTAWIDALAAGVAAVMRQPGPLQRRYRPPDGSAAFFQDFCNWQRIEELRGFVRESPAACLAAQLMGSRTARFFHDHILVKEAGNSTVTPWHHDQPYYCVQGQSVSFWIPLDAVSRAIALECVAGSHRWNTRGYRPRRFDGSPLYAADDLSELPDVEARRAELTIRSWDMEPGDAVAFDFRTIHGAPANTAPRSRRVFSARWVGDDATFVARGARGSPPFTHLTLRDGQPFDAPECPVIYRAADTPA
jgi:ectoine hydroxylase-related dioxygenase (phytanoyl-CoA dioxygenase family)